MRAAHGIPSTTNLVGDGIRAEKRVARARGAEKGPRVHNVQKPTPNHPKFPPLPQAAGPGARLDGTASSIRRHPSALCRRRAARRGKKGRVSGAAHGCESAPAQTHAPPGAAKARDTGQGHRRAPTCQIAAPARPCLPPPAPKKAPPTVPREGRPKSPKVPPLPPGCGARGPARWIRVIAPEAPFLALAAPRRRGGFSVAFLRVSIRT